MAIQPAPFMLLYSSSGKGRRTMQQAKPHSALLFTNQNTHRELQGQLNTIISSTEFR